MKNDKAWKTEAIDSYAEEVQELVRLDGFDDCVVGVVSRCGEEDRLCYDESAIISRLRRQGMSHDDAVDYFNFNIAGAYVGKATPCFVSRFLKPS